MNLVSNGLPDKNSVQRSLRRKRLILLSSFLFFTFIAACGRRGDPVALEPYKEVGMVKDLEATIKDENIYLTWGLPDEKSFPEKALKGFVIFRAKIYEGETMEECECQFRSLDFVVPDKQENFEYLDKKAIKAQSYLYKIVVMDKNNRMGKDSNTVFVEGLKPEPEEVIVVPDAPTGLLAVYTLKSIVLTWDELKGQNINFYKIYRSVGDYFFPIGESVTPVFTDRNIEVSKKYYYRVTAVAEAEGPPSQEIEVVTEIYRP